MIQFLVVILFSAASFVLGIFLRDFLGIGLVKEVRVGEVGAFFTSISVALSVPFIIHRWLERQKVLKTFVIEDVREFERMTLQIKARLEAQVDLAPLSNNESRCIQLLFNDCDLKLAGVVDFVKGQSKSRRVNTALQQAKDSYIEWWKYVTGDDGFNGSAYSVSARFYKDQCVSLSKLHRSLRDIISSVNGEI